MKKILILMTFVFLVGCATSPSKQKIPRKKVKDIIVGKTTQREIYNNFGKPIYHGSRTKDEAWWMYIHTADDNSESLSLYFDKYGRVADYQYTPFRRTLAEKLQ